ncbi:TVP38/TMEM64 family protein [Arhodomonas sp. SL1]|uniref:TVP38/TMEM64 family protein n=1 Tax=Arhodomonas sp. SL1 TaxID=3425691 RepID=UPI003F8831B9
MSGEQWRRLAVVAAVAALIGIGLWHREQFTVAALRAQLDALGAWAPLAFVAAYAAGAVAFLPGLVFTIAAGVLFGPWAGTLWAVAGATTGATLAFLIARYVAGDWVARRTGGRLRRLIDGVEAEGWRFVAFTRLVPLFPFNLLNYALGLTRIALLHYVLASAVFMVPGALAYAWVGHAGATAVAGDRGAVNAILIAVGALAAVAFLPRLVRRYRQGRPDAGKGEV